MATWQYRLRVVPVSSASSATKADLADLDLPLWNGCAAGWLGKIAADLGLSEGRSWRSNLAVWGDLAREYMSESSHAGGVLHAELGIDANVFDRRRAEQLAHALERHAAVLVDDEGAVIPAAADPICRAFLASSAARFVADPRAFFADLKKSPIRERDEDD